jgi:hypothetical protein
MRSLVDVLSVGPVPQALRIQIMPQARKTTFLFVKGNRSRNFLLKILRQGL